MLVGANVHGSVRREGVEHPLPLAAVLVLVVNDHVLKGAGVLPSSVTGKLSDVAGLFFFPILLVTIARASLLRISKQHVWIASVTTALAFSAIKLSGPINALVERAWGPMTMDGSDLLALPMCAAAAFWMTRPGRAARSASVGSEVEPRRWGRFLVIVFASLATVATPAMHYPPCREPEKPLQHVTWEQTCFHAPELDVRLSPGVAHVRMPLRLRAGPCEQPMRSFGLEWQATPDVLARAEARLVEAKLPAVIEQAATFEADIDLPYPAHCQGLRVRIMTRDQGDFAMIDTVISACTEGP
jgi:hypothetical protein